MINKLQPSIASAAPLIPYFAVVTPLFRREQDPLFKFPCLTSLSSLARQSYKNWVLIIVGDGLAKEDFGYVFEAVDKSGIPREKVMMRIMDEMKREKNIYKDKDEKFIWNFAGVNALNLGLQLAYELKNITHIARLDDDDVFDVSHLQNLAQAYMDNPAAKFAYTQATGYLNYSSFPVPRQKKINTVNLVPPMPCFLIHSTASWSTDLILYYRQELEQRQSNRSDEAICCSKKCNKGTILPADADLWERVYGLVSRGEVVSLFINKTDVFYTDIQAKEAVYCLISTGSLATCNAKAIAGRPINNDACANIKS